MANQNLINDPSSADRTPKLSLQIISRQPAFPGATASFKTVTTDYVNLKEYSYDSDILTLGDPFCVKLSNVDGAQTGAINPGDTAKLFVGDADVYAGANTPILIGVVTGVDIVADNRGGTEMTIKGADLGWHLVNNTGPLFTRYRNSTFNQVLASVLDTSWGFKGIRSDNDFNRKIKLGRRGVLPLTLQVAAVVPVIQWEPGQMIADVLIELARFQKLLVNVSADGYLQFFKPNFTQNHTYTLHHHAITDNNRKLNNVQSARLSQSLDGHYTRVTCVGQVMRLPPAAGAPGYFNVGKIKRNYISSADLPFVRTLTFSDSNQMDGTATANRAQWKWQRGQFDSWTAEYTVKGHSSNGSFWTPDSMVDISDTVLNIQGNYYISAVRFNRNMQDGARTVLTIKKPNLLGA